ncbi:CRISPR-associated helicase Cas3' [Pelosinus sp. sgz500959]|uniref:CRISPR-associated helicase Cas3' n=1 Tax=Pelosinus sp. sgz500959 TaxID=3242472 RepID=UPI00366D0FEC
MKRYFFAKSNPRQTIEEHTKDAIRYYEQLKVRYPSILTDEEWILLKDAILYHDLGKIDIKFENQILSALKLEKIKDEYKNIESIPHNILSCAFLDKLEMKKKYPNTEYEVLLKAIYYHHHREYDVTDDTSWYIENVMQKYKTEFTCTLVDIPETLNTDFFTRIKFKISKENYKEMLRKYLVIKGLLNRVDYAASAGIENIEEDYYEDGVGLTQKVHNMFAIKGHNLRPVQQYMLENREKNLVVIAATGIGKTEASLLWIGDSKGFYTLPLKVSINAIFERIIKEVAYQKVGLLHSDALSYHLHEQSNNDMDSAHVAYTCAKLLSKTLTVTTIDQLFKFVFRYNGGEMALATLSYSRLIIDEIQMYSKELVAIILVALKTITDLGGSFAIVTATFPPVLFKFMEKLKIPVECSKTSFHSEFSKRHRIKLLEGTDFDYEIIAELAKKKKVLIIANTVSRAQRIYDKIKSNKLKNKQDINVQLLHSSFIKKHRKILEDQILKFAPNNKEKRSDQPGIWISTQIVEASLDIDFDVLFTEMCTIDSLLQRLGRVYRSRFYDLVDEPNIFILDGKNGYGKVVDPELYKFSLAAVQAFDGQLLEESDDKDLKQEMIYMVYDPKCNPEIWGSKYCREIDKKIDTLINLKMYEMDKKDVQREFRDIQTKTIIPESIYNMLKQNGDITRWGKEIEDPSTSNQRKQLIKDEILQYTINLSHYENELNVLGRAELIYKNSKIYLYSGSYEFDEATYTGIGLIRNQKSNKSSQMRLAEFI